MRRPLPSIQDVKDVGKVYDRVASQLTRHRSDQELTHTPADRNSRRLRYQLGGDVDGRRRHLLPNRSSSTCPGAQVRRPGGSCPRTNRAS